MLKLAIAILSTATIAAVVPAASAGASTAPASSTAVAGHTTTLCRYQISGLRPGGRLNVRSGPGTRYRKIASFRAHAWLSGPCHTRHGWVRVVRGKHSHGWVSRHLLRRAATLLAQGESVIIDASWTASAHREAAAALAEHAQADLVALRCSVPAGTAAVRMRNRIGGASDADRAIADAMAAAADPWPQAHRIDTGEPVVNSLRQALQAVRPHP